MVIVTAGHGHLLGLWRLRLWFVYTVLCLCVRDLVDSDNRWLGDDDTPTSRIDQGVGSTQINGQIAGKYAEY